MDTAVNKKLKGELAMRISSKHAFVRLVARVVGLFAAAVVNAAGIIYRVNLDGTGLTLSLIHS